MNEKKLIKESVELCKRLSILKEDAGSNKEIEKAVVVAMKEIATAMKKFDVNFVEVIDGHVTKGEFECVISVEAGEEDEEIRIKDYFSVKESGRVHGNLKEEDEDDNEDEARLMKVYKASELAVAKVGKVVLKSGVTVLEFSVSNLNGKASGKCEYGTEGKLIKKKVNL